MGKGKKKGGNQDDGGNKQTPQDNSQKSNDNPQQGRQQPQQGRQQSQQSGQQPQESRQQSRPQQSGNSQKSQQKVHKEWNCSSCGYLNYSKNVQCRQCSVPKDASQESVSGTSQQSGPGTSQQFTERPQKQPKQQKPNQQREFPQQSQVQQQKQESVPWSKVEASEQPKKETTQWPKQEVVQQKQPEMVKEEAQQPQEPSKKANKDNQGKGVWICPKCEQKNFARLTNCKNKKCNEPRPKEAPVDPTTSSSQISRESSSQSTSDMPDVSSLQISPSKKVSSGIIECNPNGKVYEGTRGRKCKVEVNYASINFVNLPKACYHYDVTFLPDAPKKMLPAALQAFMTKFFPNYVYGFDGRKNMYTNQKLQMKGTIIEQYSQKVEAHLGDRSREFEVKIQYAAEVDMGVLLTYKNAENHNIDKPAKAIQALDIILRSAFRRNIENGTAIPTGRAVFFVPDRQSDLGDGMELWYGLFQSAILGRAKIYLNVDVLHKAFPSSLPVLELLRTYDFRTRTASDIPQQLDYKGKEKLNEFLQMLSIGYRLNRNEPIKTFGFNGVGEEASRVQFEHNGRKMTIQQYFENVKGIKLRYPNLPVLWVGSKVKKTYLPIEFCEVPPGQATNKKCTPNVTRGLIRYSATSTDERKKKIRALLDKINYGIDPTIKGFGIQVDKTFEKTDARVIDPPKLKYKNTTVTPAKGVWNEEKFLEVRNEKIKWSILNVDNRTNSVALKNLKDSLMREASRQGIFLEDVPIRDILTVNLRDRNVSLVNILADMKQKGFQLVVAVVNDFDNAYAQVKQAAELSVGILTQCIKANTVGTKLNPSTLKNILLKLNAKLNGKNHEIEEISYQSFNSAASGVMFVGADVTHPSPDQRSIPSVVGVASSYDSVGFRYCCAWRLQNPKEEMIKDLENILVEHLHYYKAVNKKLPAKIMYYRDGVSDGQFKEVLEKEMTAIRGALKRMYGPNQESHAAVTFIVVQKRHHTRFFPTDPKFADGKNNNIMPGTVVDKDIVHPFQYQFFLASHAAIQGVTKPTKYCILVNESNISPDDLQAVTYDLCHLFTRCSRSVSYPAPTYYAHLVAARGKNYIIGRKLNMDKLQDEYKRLQINSAFVQNTPMFFV